MKDCILFLHNLNIQIVSDTAISHSNIYPFFMVENGIGCEVETLYTRGKRMRRGYVTIEHYYTNNHVSIVLCSVVENHGFYLYLVGNQTYLYLLRDNHVTCFRYFVKIRRLSKYKKKWFIQLEHWMTLFTFQIDLDEGELGVYSLGSVSLYIDPLFGERREFYYSLAVGCYL